MISETDKINHAIDLIGSVLIAKDRSETFIVNQIRLINQDNKKPLLIYLVDDKEAIREYNAACTRYNIVSEVTDFSGC